MYSLDLNNYFLLSKFTYRFWVSLNLFKSFYFILLKLCSIFAIKLLPGYSVLISSSLLTALLVSASLVTALLITALPVTALLCSVTLIYCAISYYRALEVKPSSLSIHDSITNTKFHAEI